MNYYEIYDRYSGELLTRGNAAECRKALGCASLDSFYALANRARRGINKKYRVVIKKGGQADYPVLGKDDPLYLQEGGIASGKTETDPVQHVNGAENYGR